MKGDYEGYRNQNVEAQGQSKPWLVFSAKHSEEQMLM